MNAPWFVLGLIVGIGAAILCTAWIQQHALALSYWSGELVGMRKGSRERRKRGHSLAKEIETARNEGIAIGKFQEREAAEFRARAVDALLGTLERP